MDARNTTQAKKGGKRKGCLFILILQIILLGVWGALCFVLGMSIEQDSGGQSILNDIQTQTGVDATLLSEIINNSVQAVGRNPSVTLDNGVVVEIIETKRWTDIDFQSNFPSADREWWGIRFKGTNYSTKPVVINLCIDGITDQDGNSFNCGMLEYYFKDTHVLEKLDGYLIMDPTFSDEAYIIYGFPSGTHTLTWPIKYKVENKEVTFPLK